MKSARDITIIVEENAYGELSSNFCRGCLYFLNPIILYPILRK